MKVAYLTGAVGIGGAETFLLNVSEMPQVESYFFLFQPGPLFEALKQRGARVYLANSKFRIRNPLSWLSVSNEIVDFCRRMRIDCVHSSMAYAALAGAWASKRAGLPHLWFQHGPGGGWLDALAGRLPHWGVICNSTYTMHQQQRLTPNKTCFLLPLGTPVVEPTRFREGGPLRVVMACRAQEWKGPHLFQDAILQMQDSDVLGTLFLAESENSYAEKIRAKGGVRILPPDPSVHNLFAQQDVLVNASLTPEPFGLTLIEAMMRGIVPIAPRSGGPLEIIDDGENGLLFEPGNVSDLAEKIRLLKDLKTRRTMSDKARDKAVKCFSVEKMYERLWAIYQSVSN
ncbi:MAG: glycosyltransferase family 4 protein [Planctomycetaceae bacterium]|nr:glycosyltransferase family 4 protein [Planctomycetaceae bacterium]